MACPPLCTTTCLTSTTRWPPPLRRSSGMLERRRPVLAAWATFVTGKTADNVVELLVAP